MTTLSTSWAPNMPLYLYHIRGLVLQLNVPQENATTRANCLTQFNNVELPLLIELASIMSVLISDCDDTEDNNGSAADGLNDIGAA